MLLRPCGENCGGYADVISGCGGGYVIDRGAWTGQTDPSGCMVNPGAGVMVCDCGAEGVVGIGELDGIGATGVPPGFHTLGGMFII